MEAAISKTDIGHIKNIVLGLSQSGIQLSKYSMPSNIELYLMYSFLLLCKRD